MIDVECPHCKRILKISEKYIGVEGACKHCGGRLVIAVDTPPSAFEPSPHAARPADHVSPELGTQQETINALTANIEVLHAQLSQSRQDIERLAKEMNVGFVDIYEAWMDRVKAGTSLSSLIIPGLDHPNEAGYRIIAEELMKLF